MYKPLILNDNLKPNILDSILDPLQKSAKFSMDLDSIAAAMLARVECEEPPYSYMIKSKNGLWYHGYRFDQSLCDEAAHTSPRLNKIFGSPTESRGTYFRQVQRWKFQLILNKFKPNLDKFH